MTLQQLEYVVALDSFRHFVKAADHCMVAQPTLTMQVKKLEDEIGIQLFDRNKKPLQPTAMGVHFILKARQILREVEQLKAFVSDDVESLSGEYSIGIIPTLAPYLLPLFLPDFILNNPDITMVIKEMQTEQIIDNLKKGIIDIGLAATPLNDKALREVPLFYEPFLLYLPKNHALEGKSNIAANMIDTNEMLFLEEGHCFREQALNLCKIKSGKSVKGFNYESGSIEALKNLVNKEVGYTMVPELSVLNELGNANIKRFTEPEPVREISVIAHNSFTKEALLEHLHDSITKNIPERFKKKNLFTRVKWR